MRPTAARAAYLEIASTIISTEKQSCQQNRFAPSLRAHAPIAAPHRKVDPTDWAGTLSLSSYLAFPQCFQTRLAH